MKNLHFRDDGSFTIVQFTDLHWQNGEPEDLRTDSLMRSVLQAERPDLVVFTGDVIFSGRCTDPVNSYRNVVKTVEELQIPWAAVFGNHDAEVNCTKEDLLRVQQEHPHCLTESGPELDDRIGNYILQIKSPKSGEPQAALYLFDSGGGTEYPVHGYEWITHRQIAWYKESSKQLLHANHRVPLNALAFLHIPFAEYQEVWDTQTCYGHKFENVCCAKLNSGLFSAFVEVGDVKGVFVGHDHVNDYWGELYGVRLCYGRATGYHTYGKEGFPRGARVIRLQEGEPSFQSWLRLDDGTKVEQQPEHAPEKAGQRT